jgi:NADP-dependent 3-hydroxy acid dehydrogenase YdfG
MELRKRTAIVTGASSGLGAQFSRDLVAEGMTVYGLARRADRLQALQTELNGLDGDGRFIGVELDVTDEPALAEWVGGAFEGPGSAEAPAVLVNNAGFGAFGAVDTFPVETWDRMVATNLSAVFYLTRLVVPHMKSTDRMSHIVNISSVAGLMGNANLSAYNATKFALRGFSEALFKELRESGIRVTCLFPGSIATEFFEPLGMPLHENMMRAEDVSASMLHVLKAPDRMLINEITMRPSNPNPPGRG